MGFGAKQGFPPWTPGFAGGALVIPNPGWETGGAGGWTLTPGSSGGVCAVSAVDPRSGIYHLLLTKAGAGSQSYAYVDLGTYNSIPGLIGQRIRFSVYGKAVGTPTTDLQLQITYIGSAQGATTVTFTLADNGGVYKLHSVTSVAIPSDTTNIRLFVATSSGGGGSWRVDDMTLELL